MVNVAERNTDRSRCCGCSACVRACPCGALSMKADPMGFLYPVVDSESCIGCGACLEACPFKEEAAVPDAGYMQDAYVARDPSALGKSQSGGVAFSLMKKMVLEGGVVYGAALSDSFMPVHMRAATMDGIERFRLSKYAQSSTDGVLPQVIEDLEAGRRVLFTGTPCQTAGVFSAVNPALRKNLFLMDIICHGVPAPELWRAYLEHCSAKAGSPVRSAMFRNPSFGWHKTVQSIGFEDGTTLDSDEYSFLFYKDIALRPSCGSCPFASLRRPSDITAGDCWGVEEAFPELADGKPWSLVLCNSEKGAEFFAGACPGLQVTKIDVQRVLQHNLRSATALDPRWTSFEKDLPSRGFAFVNRKYGKASPGYRIRSFIAKVKRHL